MFDYTAKWKTKYINNLTVPTTSSALLGRPCTGYRYFCSKCLSGHLITPDDATENVVKTLYHPEDDIDWGDDSPTKLEDIAIKLHTNYYENIASKQHYVVVEAKCNELRCVLNISLTGTTDRICANNGYGIVDIKTGKNAIDAQDVVKTQGHIAQIGVYKLLTEHFFSKKITAPATIIAMKTSKRSTGESIAIGSIIDAKELLIGTATTKRLLEYAAHLVSTKNFYGNPRSMLCIKNIALSIIRINGKDNWYTRVIHTRIVLLSIN